MKTTALKGARNGRTVGTTVTSNEDYIRLEVYEGRLPLDDAAGELLRLHHKTDHLAAAVLRINAALDVLSRYHALAAMPWPVRWWRWWKGGW